MAKAGEQPENMRFAGFGGGKREATLAQLIKCQKNKGIVMVLINVPNYNISLVKELFRQVIVPQFTKTSANVS